MNEGSVSAGGGIAKPVLVSSGILVLAVGAAVTTTIVLGLTQFGQATETLQKIADNRAGDYIDTRLTHNLSVISEGRIGDAYSDDLNPNRASATQRMQQAADKIKSVHMESLKSRGIMFSASKIILNAKTILDVDVTDTNKAEAKKSLAGRIGVDEGVIQGDDSFSIDTRNLSESDQRIINHFLDERSYYRYKDTRTLNTRMLNRLNDFRWAPLDKNKYQDFDSLADYIAAKAAEREGVNDAESYVQPAIDADRHVTSGASNADVIAAVDKVNQSLADFNAAKKQAGVINPSIELAQEVMSIGSQIEWGGQGAYLLSQTQIGFENKSMLYREDVPSTKINYNSGKPTFERDTTNNNRSSFWSAAPISNSESKLAVPEVLSLAYGGKYNPTYDENDELSRSQALSRTIDLQNTIDRINANRKMDIDSPLPADKGAIASYGAKWISVERCLAIGCHPVDDDTVAFDTKDTYNYMNTPNIGYTAEDLKAEADDSGEFNVIQNTKEVEKLLGVTGEDYVFGFVAAYQNYLIDCFGVMIYPNGRVMYSGNSDGSIYDYQRYVDKNDGKYQLCNSDSKDRKHLRLYLKDYMVMMAAAGGCLNDAGETSISGNTELICQGYTDITTYYVEPENYTVNPVSDTKATISQDDCSRVSGGAYGDGMLYIMCAETKNGDTVVLSYSPDGSLKQKGSNLTDQPDAKDMTFASGGTLLAGQPNKKVCKINANTLNQLSCQELEFPTNTVCYYNGTYIINGYSYNDNLESNSREIININSINRDGGTIKAAACNSNYIYYTIAGKNKSQVVQYNWRGMLLKTFDVNTTEEIEGIWLKEGEVWTSFYSNPGNYYVKLNI